MTKLAIRALAKRFEAFTAVENVDLETGEGEFVSLLGPSGCGKTTTLRCVAGLEDPTSGTILFDDVDVTHLAPERRSIGMVFQNYALFPHMTVAENVGFGLMMRGIRGAPAASRIASVLDMVQLSNAQDRYPRQMSGGQQQRVALARALVFEPKLLLLDEPLANLDAKLRDEMRFFIRSLQQRVGITTLYVTHDQAEAMAMSDRIVVMFGGRIHQVGGAQDIYHRPTTKEVAGFIGQANLFAADVKGRDGDLLLLRTPFGEFRARSGDPEAALSAGAGSLMVRPEAVRLAPAAAAAGLSATVEEAHFLGNIVDYKLRLADGTPVAAQAIGDLDHTPGTQVSVSFDENRSWLVL
ncbi:ABC transporter ATP-binding protein [Mesorhizobium australicum]|uniref:Putative spermidine/putrescine transport system ATP-binding protein n=1 Tax=Mesorhizobium australicum TaxID=536018 RepID=A0A1X7MYW5_9HYPH|nr:ABC transporter ATP-binding protein [Mesorhizobium australicum]SMH29656.1 putative spermidine/putrescine transport system ATP-binding protein [Mesorhizobium australicum]